MLGAIPSAMAYTADAFTNGYSLRNKKVSKILEESDAILSELARGIYECVNYNEEPKKR